MTKDLFRGLNLYFKIYFIFSKTFYGICNLKEKNKPSPPLLKPFIKTSTNPFFPREP
jgi:hypothetical protein